MSASSAGMAEALALFMETCAPMVEAVDGYRADLERRGWSPTAAETMALDFNRLLVAQFIKALS